MNKHAIRSSQLPPWRQPHGAFLPPAALPRRFTLGQPFRPFEQLLSVQPASSRHLLPEPYQWLMTDPSSPILDFYPTEFEVDMEGKRADWEGVVLVPFIDEQRLLKAAASVKDGQLTADERRRNTLGDMLVFTASPLCRELDFCTSTLPAHFPDVLHGQVRGGGAAPCCCFRRDC